MRGVKWNQIYKLIIADFMQNKLFLGIMIFFGVVVVSTVGALLTTQTTPMVLTEQNVSLQNTNQDQEVTEVYDGNQLVAAVLLNNLTYYNTEQSWVASTNPPNGQDRSDSHWSCPLVKKTTAPNTFSSTVSQLDANSIAQNDARKRAESEASTLKCTYYYFCTTNQTYTAYCSSGYVGGPVTETISGWDSLNNYSYLRSTVSTADACASSLSVAKQRANSALASACKAIPNCVGPDGAQISVGNSKSYFKTNSVPSGGSCVSEVRSCVLTSGSSNPPIVSLSGSNLYSTCIVSKPTPTPTPTPKP